MLILVIKKQATNFQQKNQELWTYLKQTMTLSAAINHTQ